MTYIDRSSIEMADEHADSKCPKNQLLELWDEMDVTVGTLDAAELVPLSEFGFDCNSSGEAELRGVDLENGSVKLVMNVSGVITVDVDYLSERLKKEVERVLSLLPDGETVSQA